MSEDQPLGSVNPDNKTSPEDAKQDQAPEKQTVEMNQVTGLPVVSEEVKTNMCVQVIKWILGPTITLAVFGALASIIYYAGSKDKYDAKLQVCKANQLQWAMIAVIVFTLAVGHLNSFPGFYKKQFTGKFTAQTRNLLSNPFIYKQATDPTGEQGSAVIFNNDGAIGSYNRANRSLNHFLENSLPLIVTMPFVFYIFPFPAFVLIVIFCLGRTLHQIGYAKYGFGGHWPGFALARISMGLCSGLLMIAIVTILTME